MKIISINYTNIKYLVKENQNFKKNIEDLDVVYKNFFKILDKLKGKRFAVDKRKFGSFIEKLKVVYDHQEKILTPSGQCHMN